VTAALAIISLLAGALYGLFFQMKFNAARAALKATGRELEHSLGELEITRAELAKKDAALSDEVKRSRYLQKVALAKNPGLSLDVLRDLGVRGYEAASEDGSSEVPDGKEAGTPSVLRPSRR
jgi:hypothetical protein